MEFNCICILYMCICVYTYMFICVYVYMCLYMPAGLVHLALDVYILYIYAYRHMAM